MQAPNGYDHSKNPETIEYRPMTAVEARSLRSGDHPSVICNDGKLRNVKVTSVKTWKRDPQRLEVHVKFGMYEFTTLTPNADGTMDRLVVTPNDAGWDPVTNRHASWN